MTNKDEPAPTNTEEEYKTELLRSIFAIQSYTRKISGWISFIGILIIIAVVVQLLDSCAAAL